MKIQRMRTCMIIRLRFPPSLLLTVRFALFFRIPTTIISERFLVLKFPSFSRALGLIDLQKYLFYHFLGILSKILLDILCGFSFGKYAQLLFFLWCIMDSKILFVNLFVILPEILFWYSISYYICYFFQLIFLIHFSTYVLAFYFAYILIFKQQNICSFSFWH